MNEARLPTTLECPKRFHQFGDDGTMFLRDCQKGSGMKKERIIREICGNMHNPRKDDRQSVQSC
jgi:hypothetical protein